MSVTWQKTPFVRLLLPFLAGILLAIYLSVNIPYSWFIFGVLLFLYLIVTGYRRISASYKLRWLSGVLINLLFLLTGYQLVLLNTEITGKNHFSRYTSEAEAALIKLKEPISETARSFKSTAEVVSIQAGGEWKLASGKAIIYFKKDSSSSQLKYGDIILVRNKFQPVPPPYNPNQFDYKRYLSFNQIHHQSYFTSNDWANTNLNKGNFIFKTAHELRQNFIEVLEDHVTSKHELAVASALILGYKNLLDDEIKQAYSATGAMHVLAVSGLHVGIIFLILNFLLAPMEKSMTMAITKQLILLLSIWFFALITGFSPSIIRASTMFSFVIVGKIFNRNSSIYNTLAASAFFILCIDPFMIMEVGFQLSYMAVLGIVFLQPKIYNLWAAPNLVLDKIWGITAVSIAAQAATFPIGLLYFHQFPVYFLLSNLVVIPAATVILSLGILLFALSPFKMLAFVPGLLLHWILVGLNWIIFYFEQLPFSLVQGIDIEVWETWVIYLFLLMLVSFFVQKRAIYLQLTLIAAFVLAVQNSAETLRQQKQKQLTIYHVPNTAAYEFSEGRKIYFLSDSALLQNEDQLLFHIKHNWWDKGVKEVKFLTNSGYIKEKTFLKEESYIQYLNKEIAIINKPLPDKVPQQKLKLDYLIVSGNPYLKMDEVKQFYEPEQIIFDSSNKKWLASRWLKECEELNLNCYSVLHSGAFQKEL